MSSTGDALEVRIGGTQIISLLARITQCSFGWTSSLAGLQ